MKILKAILALVLLAAAFVGGYAYKSWFRSSGTANTAAGGRKILYYVDPMHPAYKSDKPGVAPDCGMKLEPVYADGGPAAAASAQPKGKILYYRDPQNPGFKSDKPGLNPETGNELQPVYANDLSSLPMGTIQISSEKQQQIGVQYGTVEMTSGGQTIRAVGKVTYDETRLAHVHTKYEGWIDKVYVDFVGKLVEKGQPLLTIYSPDLLASQQELLLAVKAKEVMKKSTLEGVIDQSETLFQAAKRRLELWDLSEAQIQQVLATGQPIKNITLYSPIRGYVLERKAFSQVKVMPDTDLYTVVDLSRVWIMADVYEYEAPNIRLGQTARVTLSYDKNRSFLAKVSYIQPQVDPMTRTLKVRLDAGNPGLALKPDMYVDVTFNVDSAPALTVPSGAVLQAGDKNTVYVGHGEGYLEPRDVTIGEQKGDRITILKGLKAGERIVTSGNFLVDSESQLKSAASGMGGMPGMPGMAKPETPAKPPKPPAGKSAAKAMADMPEMGDKKR
jgi:membrane fusion protein, copper/silver efflux system